MDAFVFESRVLALGLLADANQIHIVVPALDPRKGLYVDYVGIEIEFAAKLHVERLQVSDPAVIGSGDVSCSSFIHSVPLSGFN